VARVKLYSGIVVLSIAALLIGGCACGVKTYTDPGQAISVGVNKEFVIALGSNPTTGYSWQESYDETMLKLVEKTYKPGKAAKLGLIGAGGVEYFRFKALKAGTTEITMDYKRPWEEKAIDQKVFAVNIT
jgi:inhibitor of cysteine peptidase